MADSGMGFAQRPRWLTRFRAWVRFNRAISGKPNYRQAWRDSRV